MKFQIQSKNGEKIVYVVCTFGYFIFEKDPRSLIGIGINIPMVRSLNMAIKNCSLGGN